ncbi:MAG: hypothetical protein ACLPJW_17555 [Rhodomicrobium sp.]
MNEKQILIGLVEAVSALAEKVTGQRLEIYIRDESGSGAWFYAGDDHRWTTIQDHLGQPSSVMKIPFPNASEV